jgi:hypothetical protein
MLDKQAREVARTEPKPTGQSIDAYSVKGPIR